MVGIIKKMQIYANHQSSIVIATCRLLRSLRHVPDVVWRTSNWTFRVSVIEIDSNDSVTAK